MCVILLRFLCLDGIALRSVGLDQSAAQCAIQFHRVDQSHQACVDQAKKECRSGFKPELSAKVDDMQKYDVIFVGSPNWWGTMAPPVATFLTSYDLKGKTVIPFFTHGGGGVQNCERDVRKLCNGSNLPKAGVFSGGSVRRSGDAIANWVNEVVTVKK